MRLKDYIRHVLDDLSEIEGGIVHFDIVVTPHHPDDRNDEVRVIEANENTEGLSRIQFDVKLKSNPAKEE